MHECATHAAPPIERAHAAPQTAYGMDPHVLLLCLWLPLGGAAQLTHQASRLSRGCDARPLPS